MTAAGSAGAVLGDPRVGAMWEQPSALARMDVGAVAAHLYLVVRRVAQHLDGAAAPLPSVPMGRYPILTVDDPAALDHEVHQRVQADAAHVARRGWSALCAAYTGRVADLEVRLAGAVPARIRFGAGVIDFGEYLASRVVEVVVHADDLAASVGRAMPLPAPEVTDVALGFLVRASRQAHGDLAVLRAFTRRERVEGAAPYVY